MAKIMTLVVALMMPNLVEACANEVELLAKNIYYEARGEGRHGMRLVADVTMNRTRSHDFPDTVCSVIRQPGQFSWFSKKNESPKGESWKVALDIAEEAIQQGPRFTDALYFKTGRSNTWQNRKRKLVHGNHSFY